jgi:hypothetical protein
MPSTMVLKLKPALGFPGGLVKLNLVGPTKGF